MYLNIKRIKTEFNLQNIKYALVKQSVPNIFMSSRFEYIDQISFHTVRWISDIIRRKNVVIILNVNTVIYIRHNLTILHTKNSVYK